MRNQNRSNRIRKTFRVYLPVLFLAVMMTASAGMAANMLRSDSNLSFRLQALSENLVLAPDKQMSLQTMGLANSGPLSLIENDQGQLLVYIRVTDTSEENTGALEKSGASITHVDSRYRIVTAYVSLAHLQGLAGLPFVENITEVTRPMINQAGCPGAVTSEGDGQLRADVARTTNSVDGSGVTVGVLSDSYAGVTTPTSANDDILSGDLPGTGNPCGHTTPVVVLEDYSTNPSDEGRAMMQIVHDLAPGASLAFATAFSGFTQFADNIRALRNTANADIIVDDVSYFNEPFFQDGPISVAISDVVNAGAVYFTSAGNSNELDGNSQNVSSYEASAYRPTTCPSLTYQGNPVNIGTDCHNFDPTGTTPYQELQLADQGYFIAALQWAEPWYGVVTDMDFFVVDTSNNILAFSTSTNTGSGGTQTPYESVQYQNTSGSPENVRFIIARYSGTGTPRSKYVLFRSGNILSSLFNASNNSTDTFGPTVSGHSGSDDALSIAAVPYNDSTSPESFTSQGFFTAYYGPVTSTTPAAALPTPDVRQKPDVAATDGGANTFFGQLVGSTWRFYGTSAAAPHAAAVSALMHEAYYNTYTAMPTKAMVEPSMENTAATIANGSQVSTGAGLIDAVAAITQVLTYTGGGGGGGGGGGTSGSSSGGCFISVFK